MLEGLSSGGGVGREAPRAGASGTSPRDLRLESGSTEASQGRAPPRTSGSRTSLGYDAESQARDFSPPCGVFVRRPHPALSHRARPRRLGRAPSSRAPQAGLDSVQRGRRGSPAHDTPLGGGAAVHAGVKRGTRPCACARDHAREHCFPLGHTRPFLSRTEAGL